jgi:PKD repeat protein
VQGFGTVLNDVTITGILSPFNSLGTLVFNKKLTLASTTTTTVQLGTTANATVVGGALALGGTLNITDGGGFAAGTYMLFTYNGTLTTSGLTIGTTPTGGFTCTIDTNTAGVVKLDVTGGPPVAPVAAFSGSPTSGMAPLPVTFIDSSTGTITNRVWSFGDDSTTNTTAPTLGHTYTAAGTYTVSLTVFGPGGSSTTNRLNYITVTASSDTTPPQLQIVSPTDYQAFTNATITASGTASDASGLTGVTVNGVAASLAGTNWSHSMTLSLGTNTLTVIATDASAHLNTATQVVHAVLNSASAPTNAPPVITAGPTVTNAALQVGNVAVVVAGDTNVFSVEATNPLSYQWAFGDGVTSAWSPSNTVDHAYTTNCGPYTASVTISNGSASVTSNLTIVVACQLNVAKLAPKLNFAKTNSDSCTITGTFDLPANTSFAGMVATLDIGGGSLTFTFPSKGTALNGRSRFSRPTFNKKTGLWKFNAAFNNGFWQTDWANYGMTNATILKPGALVSDLPVILLLDTEAFMATTNLHYTAKQGKSGSAK